MAARKNQQTAVRVDQSMGQAAPPSVFKGLELAGLTTREVANICEVPVGVLDEWRRGLASMPAGRAVFLGKLLAHMVDELVRTYDDWGPAPKAWHLHMQACLENAKKVLAEQENASGGSSGEALSGAFRQGERMFDDWIAGDDARALATEAAKRVALGLDTTGVVI
ncbi:MAG: hypothetical protein HQ512_07355 [Rhodospirillales bacterium]|nr:hypothetical protein [Rhodospirillales bacterium]